MKKILSLLLLTITMASCASQSVVPVGVMKKIEKSLF